MTHASNIIDKLNDIQEKSFVQRHKGKLAAAGAAGLAAGALHVKSKTGHGDSGSGQSGFLSKPGGGDWHSKMTGGAKDSTGLHRKALKKGLTHAGGGVYHAGGDETKTAAKKVAKKATTLGDSPTQASTPQPKAKKVIKAATGGVDHGPKAQPSTERVRSTADKAKAYDATHKNRLKTAFARGRAHGSGASGYGAHVQSDAGADHQDKAELSRAHKSGERSANYGKRTAKFAAKYGIKPKK